MQRTVEAKAEFTKLESKLAAFKAIAEAHQAEPRALDESLQARLKSLSQLVRSIVFLYSALCIIAEPSKVCGRR